MQIFSPDMVVAYVDILKRGHAYQQVMLSWVCQIIISSGPVNLCYIIYIMGVETTEVRNDAQATSSFICWLGRLCEGEQSLWSLLF